MMRLRLAAGFAALVVAGLVATRSDAVPETLTSVAPGVWFREGDINHLGHCNNQVIEMKDYLIVIDANFPSGARATLADIRRVSRKPVKYVFITHHHGDHLYGASVWTADGATTLAYKGVIDEMRRYEPKRWQQEVRADVKQLRRNAPEPPMQTFESSPFVLDDGNRKVEFHHFGWAHTRGDGFAYLPKEQILCAGDAVVNGAYNYTADASVTNWPEVLHRAAALKVRIVLPGHGVPGGPDLIEGQARFMTELLKAAKQAVAQGKTLEQVVRMENGNAVSTTVQLPGSVTHWVGGGLPQQVRDAYREATVRPRDQSASGR
jgi:cyclase